MADAVPAETVPAETVLAEEADEAEGPRRPGPLATFARNKGAVAGAVLLGAWIAVAVFAPVVVPHDPTEMLSRPRQPPSSAFWLGPHLLGRDVTSRILAGSRISLRLGLVSTVLGAAPGTVLGLVAGYYGGWVDAAISRVVDALLALPSILLALVVIAALGPSIENVTLSVGLATVPLYARLVRGSVLAVRQLPFVEAALVLGNPAWRIMVHHVLANAYAPVLVLSTLQVGNAILIGSGLSFLGLGAQPPTPEWGLMSAEGREVLNRAPWISTAPGLAILSVVVACNLVGDGLRAALDPRLRTRA